ncbi:MAG: heptosyltransferase-1, partial [Paracoccaceae bacterium]
MGDVLHVMPALSDLVKAKPDVEIDWMVEDSFAEIPAWYPSVDRVIKVSTRRWRSLNVKNLREFWLFV